MNDKRIRVIVGHYGSGKTEFSVNYALKLAESFRNGGLETVPPIALIDLDIANPYFRSREKKALLAENQISVLSNQMDHDITADLPAISAAIKGPLRDRLCQVIIDAGGDQNGARILNQFSKNLQAESCDIFCIINANRPETASIEGALQHIVAIEEETGFKLTGLVNNTHMLRETKVGDILKGDKLCRELSLQRGIPVKYTCCTREMWDALRAEAKRRAKMDLAGPIFILDLHMRPSWLSR